MEKNSLDLNKLAFLARLKIVEGEKEDIEKGLKELKRLIDTILEVEVEEVEPLVHPLDKNTIFREDIASTGLSQEEALANASGTENGFFKAPRTIE